jgi:putative transposase
VPSFEKDNPNMARLPRILPADVAVHVIQRGNNRQNCFVDTQDFRVYLNWLREYSCKQNTAIHAWVLMTNHVHLLCTPSCEGAVSAMMQALGRRYVRYFNSKYERSGTLWEGRYKSCLVQDDHYLLQVYRYIERNPVRAGLATEPGGYQWSSFHENAAGVTLGVCKAHSEYLNLAPDPFNRLKRYRSFVAMGKDEKIESALRENTNKGLALGDQRFIEKMELQTGRRLRERKRGRQSKL